MSDSRVLTVERSTSTAHRLSEYDGACANIHGHNMEWEVDLVVSMEETGDDNMPLDFKKVSDLIDETDHAILLSKNDPLVTRFGGDLGEIERIFGDVIWFEGDPTTEIMSQWMARRLTEEIDAVSYAEVTVWETEKYGMEASHPSDPHPACHDGQKTLDEVAEEDDE